MTINRKKNVQPVSAAITGALLSLFLLLSACGSATGNGDNDLNFYEINGVGHTITHGENFGISLEFVNASASGGEFFFTDEQQRVELKGTSVNSITLTSGTVTVKADASFLELSDTYQNGYSFEAVIIDAAQDEFSIKIFNPDGKNIYDLASQSIDMAHGNFTIVTF